MSEKRLVFYVGMPKTGSKSWSFAFEELGWKAIHNWQANHRAAAAADWDFFRENPDGHNAFFDGLEGRHLALIRQFPDALFVTSIRSAEDIAWSHFRHNQANVVTGINKNNPGWFRWERKRRHALYHYDELLHFFSDPKRIENLHIQRIEEGWSPICEKLGLPIPAVPFPHKNVSSKLMTLRRTERDPGPQDVRD